MDQTITQATTLIDSCKKELAKRIIGQQEMINGLLMGLIAGGHVLLEGVPGLAKTLAVKSLAEITGLQFKRIQFTPDLLPADVTGTLVWEQATGSFMVRRGPIFANVILADEINRAPAKVQSALLEAMEERQVTIGERSHPLPDPFFVLATQNPIEHEGTYSLPEAELDRFLLKVRATYPSPEEEIRIFNFSRPFSKRAMLTQSAERLLPVLNTGALEVLRSAADSVHVDDRIAAYIVSIVAASRPSTRAVATKASVFSAGEGDRVRDGLYRYLHFGASPRASLALFRCARIHALFEGRTFVSPDDVKITALPVMRHRIVLSYEAEADNLDPDAIIGRILHLVPVP
ncbi:ATPase AAA [Spirochaetia bacterium]|nr:ATPase AAA [Spirochaetia bacterium]